MTLIRRPLDQVLADLPPMCATFLPTDGSTIWIKRGERGYWPADGVNPDDYNKQRGITPAQVEAMLVGSMFGFDCPGADPLNGRDRGRQALSKGT